MTDEKESTSAFKAARSVILASLVGASAFTGYSFASVTLGSAKELRAKGAESCSCKDGAAAADSKTDEGGCGEGSCGASKDDSKSGDSKADEGGCGEGSCGASK